MISGSSTILMTLFVIPPFSSSCGGVFRDASGAWQGGFTRRLGACSILMAELWGVLTALQYAASREFSHVIIETDSATSVSLITKGCSSSHPCASIILLINQFLHRDWTIQISHIYREANRAVDYLAKIGHDFSFGVYHFPAPPRESTSLLWEDLVEVYFPRTVLA